MSRLLLLPMRYPAIWAWPWAAWLTWSARYEVASGQWRLEQHYLPALALVLVGCLPSLIESRPKTRAGAAPWLPRWLLLTLTIVLLAGATVLRLWHLTTWPVEGIGFEEYQIGGRAPPTGWAQSFGILYGQPGEHALTVWAAALSFDILGTGFFELRLPFMLAGIVCPFLFYAVCRKLVSWEVSLFALALFAVSWWQIAGSRFADEIFFPIWVELAILWLILHYEDTGRAWAAYAAGVLAALLIYEYTSYHLVIVVVAGYLLARGTIGVIVLLRAADAAADRRRRMTDAVRRYAPGAVAFLLAVWIIANWQLLGDIQRGIVSWFSGGIGGHRHDADGLLAQQLPPAEMAAFVLRKLAIPVRAAYLMGQTDYCRHIGVGGHAFFDRATAAAIALGALLTGMTFWRRFHALVLVWAALVVAGAALLPANPNPHRYYTGLPLYYLLVALGAEVVWRRVRRPAARTAVLAVFAAIAGYAVVSNVHHVLWVMMPDERLRASLVWPRTEVVRWVRAHDRDEPICVVAENDESVFGTNPLQVEWKFLVRGWNVRAGSTMAECLAGDSPSDRSRYYVFALRKSAEDPAALLRAHYAGVEELAPVTDPRHEFKARVFRVPATPASS